MPHSDQRGDGTASPTRPGETDEQARDRQALAERLSTIRHRVLVLSGKGGVGKSTVAVNLSVALAESGRQVGLLDVDFHGPSVPRLLHVMESPGPGPDGTIVPVQVQKNLRVMSIGLLLPSDTEAVIWRGPMKMNVIRQFLRDVEWGELDFLIFDLPPGTGDEPLSIAQLVEKADGAVIVTTPQELALLDVRKCITFCRKLDLPVLGVIENMSGFVCPNCGHVSNIYKTGGGERMANEMGVPFLGRIPIDPRMVEACDAGTPFLSAHPDSDAAQAFRTAIQPILDLEP